MRESERKARGFAKVLRRKMTDAEIILWSKLRVMSGHKFRRQHPVGPYIADFACVAARLVVEVDGATHSTLAERAHDEKRTAFLREHGWHVYRATNDDIYNNLNGVLEGIAHALPLPSAAVKAASATSPVNGGGNKNS